MGHCYHHALSSVRKWGGATDDYLALHQWFDEPSKLIIADFRHRALRVGIAPRGHRLADAKGHRHRRLPGIAQHLERVGARRFEELAHGVGLGRIAFDQLRRCQQRAQPWLGRMIRMAHA